MDRRWHLDRLAAAAVLGDHPQHLLEEQRVSLGRLDNATAGSLVDPELARKARDEFLALECTEPLQQHGGRIQLAPTPGRARVEQLRPRDAEQQDRSVAAPVGDMLDEVEERRFGPVKIIEDEDERILTS